METDDVLPGRVIKDEHGKTFVITGLAIHTSTSQTLVLYVEWENEPVTDVAWAMPLPEFLTRFQTN